MTNELSPVLSFNKGLRDGAPIALGYLSVSFAFGILAVRNALPAWSALLISMTSFTGTGQFVGIDLIASAASLFEITFTVLIINLRYLLMSLSVSQRLAPGVGVGKRLLIAFGVTDEIFAVSMDKRSLLTPRYMAGLILSSYAGWICGTLVGALFSSAMPPTVLSALGIALYAMFIAIVIPPSRKSRPIAIVVMIATALSCAFKWVPGLNALSSGWAIIICGVASSVLCALLFPVAQSDVPGEG